MEVLTSVDAERIRALLDAHEYFWLDLCGDGDLRTVAGLLSLHPAAVEDTNEWDQLPKLDDYGDHVLLIFFSARTADGRAEPVEVHVYISGDWIFTARRCATPLDRLPDRLTSATPREEDQIVYLVLDALADGWDPVIAEIDKQVDDVEAQVLERPRQQQLPVVYRLKQQVNDLTRHVIPQRNRFPAAMDAIHALPGITRGSREWLRDVTAHLDIIQSDLGRLTGDLNDLTQSFFNANANRLNRVATLIAIGSVFFLIWTLVTGFFGQNFAFLTDHIGSEDAFWGYELGALVVPTVVLGGVLWWRRRDWW